MRAPLAAAALIFCASDGVAAQIAEHNPLERMLRETPHVRIVPGYTLLPGRPDERALAARVYWKYANSAPRLSVSLLGDIVSAGRDVYSRSGLEAGISAHARVLHLTGTGTVAVGAGAGPSQVFSVAVSAGVPAVDVAFRTTWLREDTTASASFVVPQPAPRIEHGYTDGEMRGRVRAGAARLLLTGGVRFGKLRGGPPQWLWGEAAHPISRRFSIVAAGGTRPRRPELAQHGGSFALLGIRLETGAESAPPPVVAPPDAGLGTQVIPLARNRYLLQLRLPGARRVELTGDVTNWTPVAMRAVPGVRHSWELVLEAAPGMYAINIRTDGNDWIVPPGLVAVPDRFGGTAGLLTLPEMKEDDDEAR